MTWTPEILATVPTNMLKSELARRNARLRASYSGGTLWKQHNPNTTRCRCAECMRDRDPNTLVGRMVRIKPSHDFYAGHWGIVKHFDGRFYHVSAGSIGDITPLFTRDEFTVRKTK